MFIQLQVDFCFTPSFILLKDRAGNNSNHHLSARVSHVTGLWVDQESASPARAKHDVCRHQSHGRFLRTHGPGHGHLFPLLLWDGLGFLQPEAEQRGGGRGRGGGWGWETSCFRLCHKSQRAGTPVRLHARTSAVVRRRGICTHHLCQPLGWYWQSAGGPHHVLPTGWWD